MMNKVTLCEDVMNPDSWVTHETNNVCEFLKLHFVTWPKTARIYHNYVAESADVTPHDDATVDRLENLSGNFYVVVYPEGIELIIAIIAIAVAAIAIGLSFLLRPKPNIKNQQETSPNNQLAGRENKARAGERIPDIFGQVWSTPDLVAVPYRIFVNGQEVEYSYMCVGRGSHTVSQLRDDQTPINQIAGSSVEIYGPNTSPNSGDNPQSRVGAAINTPVINVRPLSSVNGQTLIAPNLAGAGWVGPFIIGTQETTEIWFNFVAESGSYQINGTTGVQSGVTSTIQIGYTPVDAAGNATGAEVTQNINLVGSATEKKQIGVTLKLVLPANGIYSVRAKRTTNTTISANTSVSDEVKWRDVMAVAPAIGPFKRKNYALQSQNFSLSPWAVSGCTITTAQTDPYGTTLAQGLNESGTTAEHYVEQVIAGLVLTGWYTRTVQVRANGRNLICLTMFSNPTVSTYARIYFDLTTGLFSGAFTAGGVQQAYTAHLSQDGVYWTLQQSILIGGTDTAVRWRIQPATAVGTLSYAGSGAAALKLYQAQLEDGQSFTGEILTTTVPVTLSHFGDVTTVQSVTFPTPQALALKSRKLNMLVTREIPVGVFIGTLVGLTIQQVTVGTGGAYTKYFRVVRYGTDGSIDVSAEFGPNNSGGSRHLQVVVPSIGGTLKWRVYYADDSLGTAVAGGEDHFVEVSQATMNAVPTSIITVDDAGAFVGTYPGYVAGSISFGVPGPTQSAADIITAMSIDPKIGNRQLSELDLVNIYQTASDVRNYFGSELFTRFCFTFDDSKVSFEESIADIAQAMSCEAYRRGNLISLFFEKQTANSTILFNHRNKIPKSETRTISFGMYNDNDGIELDYVEPNAANFPNADTAVTLYFPSNQSAINAKKIKAVGIRNNLQALALGWRLYQKLLYQNTTVQFTATQEANSCVRNERILVADNTRQDTRDGEVVEQNVLQLKLSQPHKIPIIDFDVVSNLVASPGTPATAIAVKIARLKGGKEVGFSKYLNATHLVNFRQDATIPLMDADGWRVYTVSSFVGDTSDNGTEFDYYDYTEAAVAAAGRIITLPSVLGSGTPGYHRYFTAYLQHYDGTIEAIRVSPVANNGVDVQGTLVILDTAPTIPLVLDDTKFAKTTYILIDNKSNRTSAFLLQEKTPQDGMTYDLKATNYDDRFYAHDLDFINGLVKWNGDGGIGPSGGIALGGTYRPSVFNDIGDNPTQNPEQAFDSSNVTYANVKGRYDRFNDEYLTGECQFGGFASVVLNANATLHILTSSVSGDFGISVSPLLTFVGVTAGEYTYTVPAGTRLSNIFVDIFSNLIPPATASGVHVLDIWIA
jgi:hypothetical protein